MAVPKSDTKLTIGGEIGRGAYCTVYEGELNEKPVAVKRLHPLLLNAEAPYSKGIMLSQQFLQSAHLLKQLSYPHIVKFIEFYRSDDGHHVLITERLNCNLSKYLTDHAFRLSRQRLFDFCLQIGDAVHYLHSQQPPVVYRDLSPKNVLWLDGLLKLNSTLHAARMPTCGYFDEKVPGALPYMPPEALVRVYYNEKIDVFSLGVLMLEILTQYPPLTKLSGLGRVPEIQRRAEDLSRLPEDHPLKPIILQCLRDDPGERPDSGAVFRMLSEVCPLHQTAYNEALDKHGSVSVDVTQCILVGASGVGKSTLKHFLVHDAPEAVKTSTAVVEKPEVIAVSSEQYTVHEATSTWQLVDSDVMWRSLQVCVNAKAYDEDQYSEPLRHQDDQHQQLEEQMGSPNPPTSLNLIQKFIRFCRSTFGVSDLQRDNRQSRQSAQIDISVVTKGYNSGSSETIAMLDVEHSHFMQEMKEGCGSIKLKDASFVHLLDTGGQPSFQDALPLLLDVPCTYIQVFNAAQDLDQPVPITYRRDEHTEESLPSSTETGWEMMLRSFSSMHTLAHKSSKELVTFQQEQGQLPQLRIFVVGTFKDQLVEEGRLNEAVQDISKRLGELEGKPYYHCIQKNTAGQPCYLINNMAVKEDDKADINSVREHLSFARSSLKLKVPVMWYICKQITQGTSQKFFRFQDLKAFCLKQKFIDPHDADDQFRSLLKLFSLLGFYAFFDLKDVPDKANYVCTDKGVFVREVSKLLAVQFLQAPRCYPVEVFQHDGIICSNAELFEELGIMAEVDRSWFLAALEHVGLLARYASATDHSTSYFMPIALPQGKTKLPDRSSVASLCVTFTFHAPDSPLVYADLPRGVFCRLAVILSKGPWTPIPRESDRTTVKFHAREFELYLTEAPGFIHLTPVLVEELDGKEPLAELHKLCREMYDTLHNSIVTSAEDVLGEQFHQTANIMFGLKCGCGKVPHLATPASEKGKSLICQSTQKRHNSLKKEQIWFSPVDNTELVKVAGCNMWVMEETEIDDLSSDPPQVGHPWQKVHTQQLPASSQVGHSHPGKVHAQQYPACSHKAIATDQDALSLGIAEVPCYETFLRKHVAQNVGKQGHSLLILLGLRDAEIEMLHNDNPHNYTNAIHGGLLKFKDRGGSWGELIEAMKEAGIGVEYIERLKGELNSICC